MLKENFEPVLASDGNSLALLQKEFPLLRSYKLPSYNIQYTIKESFLRYKLILSIPSIIIAVIKERILVNEIIEKEKIEGLISDNRFGVYSNKIPSVYITHQLNVLSSKFTFLTSKIHQKIIQKFDECWVPDVADKSNLSGILGHLKGHKFIIKYMGIISRFQHKKSTIKYDLLVLLSGPEPQRTVLENKLLAELTNFKGSILVVRGVLTKQNSTVTTKNFKIIDYLMREELEREISQSNIVICRSGYSTIMDLTVIGKKAFFIPTPGQFEQEYLANRLKEKEIAPFCKQHDFTIDNLNEIKNYSGFKIRKTAIDLEMFKLFNSK